MLNSKLILLLFISLIWINVYKCILHMYLFYVCIYINVYVYICVYTYVCVYIHVCVYMCVRIHLTVSYSGHTHVHVSHSMQRNRTPSVSFQVTCVYRAHHLYSQDSFIVFSPSIILMWALPWFLILQVTFAFSKINTHTHSKSVKIICIFLHDCQCYFINATIYHCVNSS